MEMMFLDVCYYVGMFAFIFTGCWTCLKQGHIFRAPLCTILSGFGGGLVFRDLIVLKTIPSAIADNTELICAVYFACWLIIMSLYYKNIINSIMDKPLIQFILSLFDAVGSGAFISIGYLKAMDFGCTIHLCLLSGILTTFGGGMLSAIVRGEKVSHVICSSITYRVVIIFNTIYFAYMVNKSVSIETARCVTVFYTTIPCLINQIGITKLRHNVVQKALELHWLSVYLPFTKSKLITLYLLISSTGLKSRTNVLNHIKKESINSKRQLAYKNKLTTHYHRSIATS